jgi:hypothetical protein
MIKTCLYHFGLRLPVLQCTFRIDVLTKPLKRKLLKKFQLSTECKPSVDHLRIFGSLVYIHIPKEKRTKLKPSGKKGTFVGYSETSKAYRIYIPGQKFIEVSRDVTFHEETAFHRARELPCDSDEPEAPPLDSPDSLPNEQWEETSELPMDPSRDTIEFSMEIPPVKRKPAWC